MLTQRQRKQLEQLKSRHGRKKSSYFLAEGWRCCQEAINRQPGWVEQIFCAQSFCLREEGQEFLATLQIRGLSWQQLPDSEFALLAETAHPQGVLCLLRRPVAVAPVRRPKPFCLLLDQIREPGNLGTILRTAWAVGLPTVWLINGGADPYSAKVVRAGMGAQFALQLPIFANLPEAVASFRQLGGAEIWCALPAAGCSLFETEFQLPNCALVIGNESTGISSPELGRPVTIPMPGLAESLNAAQATTVFLLEAVRRGILNGGKT